MSEFFYYGQKDTIQRLNELAGRGAVVASTTPKVGMSPLGGPNGRITPAWLDPNLPIQSNARICSGSTAKYGYQFTNSVGRRNWYKLATFAPDDAGTQENLLIRGTLNDTWLSAQTSAVTLLMGVRNGFYVDWHLEGVVRNNARIVVYKHLDMTYGVYAFLDGFANASFDLTGVNTATHAASEPESGGGPAGTVVFDTSALPGQSSYIAPRWRGHGDKNIAALFSRGIAVGDGSISDSQLGAGAKLNEYAPGVGKEVLRLGVGGIEGLAYQGCFGFLTSTANGTVFKEGYKLHLRAYDSGSTAWSNDIFSVSGAGRVYMNRLSAGADSSSSLSHHVLGVEGAEGADILTVVDSGGFRKCAGGYGNLTNAALILGANTVTGRSSNNRGTVNTMGNDYAEYIFKGPVCGTVAPGQIVGINADNKITDTWGDAVIFSIKSTAPSFVGGDSWANDIGSRPTSKAGQAPIQPLRHTDAVTPEPLSGPNPPEYMDVVSRSADSDEEWAKKQELYAAALAAYNIAAQQDTAAMAAFDAALEAARQKVDRIAIAGRVPVNVLGAQPGDYIVPVQDGAGIKGIPVHEDDLSMKQYLRAVGRVIAIEADGRAYVMVKSV